MATINYKTETNRRQDRDETATESRRTRRGRSGPDSGDDDTGRPESDAAFRFPRCRVSRRVMERTRRVWPAVFLVIALNLLLPSPLWAIPSPDLVVNFFASTAQV